MRDGIPCHACGLGQIYAHYEIFAHHAVCQAYQVEALLARTPGQGGGLAASEARQQAGKGGASRRAPHRRGARRRAHGEARLG